MQLVIELALLLLQIYSYVVIAAVVVSWLIAFNVINTSNSVVRQIVYYIHQLTEPALRRIRRFLPDLGGLDISPIVLLIGIWVLQRAIVLYAPALV